MAVPLVVQGRSYGNGVMREVPGVAAELGLAVHAHPMQLHQPEWERHYLVNLLGNPVETTTAVATVLLDGVMEGLPQLRICSCTGEAAPRHHSGGEQAWMAVPGGCARRKQPASRRSVRRAVLRHRHPRSRGAEAAAGASLARPHPLR
ncbi:hypothetical protein ACIOHO_26265 [Streptomyces sp. NPDC087849]|uniref:hypothetical protein n=1 Tax=Streptomyces sp. NPDC087849 TaxID=3365808 RepID=UPI0038009F93